MGSGEGGGWARERRQGQGWSKHNNAHFGNNEHKLAAQINYQLTAWKPSTSIKQSKKQVHIGFPIARTAVIT